MSVAVEGVSSPDDESKVMSKTLAHACRQELAAQRASHGKGAPLDTAQMVSRLVRLRRRSASMQPRHRAADEKTL